MKTILGKGATVNKLHGLTNGKPCVIEAYSRKVGKYKVFFDDGWVGWYTRNELILN